MGAVRRDSREIGGFVILDKYRLCRPLEEWEFQRGAERKVVQVTPLVIAQNAEGLVAAVLAGGQV